MKATFVGEVLSFVGACTTPTFGEILSFVGASTTTTFGEV
jgi:hypothetical protein